MLDCVRLNLGIRLNEIGKAVQKYTESQGFSVVQRVLWPWCKELNSTSTLKLLHYYADDGGVILKPGMVLHH